MAVYDFNHKNAGALQHIFISDITSNSEDRHLI
jgi:hypothetical protein